MMPKPDLLPLTGGYRKTPVMQIGADIYCDTQIIVRELERRYPQPTAFPHGKGVPYALAFWADRTFFMPTVGAVFGELGDAIPEAFKKDRAEMSGGTFSSDALKANALFARDQFRAHCGFLAEQQGDGRAFMGGDAPSIDDIHCYLNVWFARSFVPQVANALLDEFPAVSAWATRVAEIGHGTVTPMDSKEALQIARDANSDAEALEDRFDPRGLKPGNAVTVAADDYGRDPVAGEIVFSNAYEIAIRRSDPRVGDVVVHFPRAGFVVAKKA
jgi:glutathione S-transferase